MISIIYRVYTQFLFGLLVLSGLAIFGIFLAVVSDVTIRAWGFKPPAWTVPVSEYLLLYFTMSAAPWLVRTRGHVYVEILASQLPKKLRFAYGRVVALFCFGASAFGAWYGATLFIEGLGSGDVDMRAIDIPGWVIYVPLPIGFGLVALEFLLIAFGTAPLYPDESPAADSLH